MNSLLIAWTLATIPSKPERTEPHWELPKESHPLLVEAIENPKATLPRLQQILKISEEGIKAWDAHGKPDPDYASFVKVLLRSQEPLVLPFVPGDKSFILLFSSQNYGTTEFLDGSRWQAMLVDTVGRGLSSLSNRLSTQAGGNTITAVLFSSLGQKPASTVRVGVTKLFKVEGQLQVAQKVGANLMGAEVLEVRAPTPDEQTAYGVEWVRKPSEARTVIVLKAFDSRTSLYLRVVPPRAPLSGGYAQVDSSGKLVYVERTSANEQNLWKNQPTFAQSWVDNSAAKSGEAIYKFVSNLAPSELKDLNCEVTASGVMNFVGFKPPQ
jgi:hypothetical protein